MRRSCYGVCLVPFNLRFLILMWMVASIKPHDGSEYTSVLIDKQLTGHVMITIFSIPEEYCLLECSKRSNKCGSVNYHRENEICEINYGLDDLNKEMSLISNIGWKYIEKSKTEQVSAVLYSASGKKYPRSDISLYLS